MTGLEVAAVVAAALVAASMTAAAGTGAGVLLLPVLVAVFGVRDAVPMYTVAHLIGNLGRAALDRRAIRWPVVRWFALGALPMAVVGGLVFAWAPEGALARVLGAFLLASVAWRRLRGPGAGAYPARRFAVIGGVFAFVSAVVGSAGPFLAPFFLAAGMARAAFIGTEAIATAAMHVAKLGTYALAGVLSTTALAVGLAIGPVMLLGAWGGRRMVHRLSRAGFARLIDAVLLVFGAWFLLGG